MDMPIEKVYEVCVAAYEQGDYATVRINWRKLSSEERLNIYYKAISDGRYDFIDFEQLNIHSLDLQIIQDAKMKYMGLLGMTMDQLRYVYKRIDIPSEFRARGNEYSEKAGIVRNLAIYTRLREYYEIFSEYPHLNKEIKSWALTDCRVFLRPARETEARTKLLMTVKGIDYISDWDFLEDLKLSALDFASYYQNEILDRLYEWKENDPEGHQILWDYSHSKQGVETFFEYLKDGLLASFGDKAFNEMIEARKKEIELERRNAEITEAIQSNMKDIYGEVVMPAGEAKAPTTPWRGGSDDTGRTNVVEAIDREKEEEFIRKAMMEGFSYSGFIYAGGGRKALGEHAVKFHLLERKGRRFLVPIGQINNRIFEVIDEKLSLEQLRQILAGNTREKLVVSGVFRRKNNITINGKSYDYEATLQKLINISELSSEEEARKVKTKARRSNTVSISQIREEVTKEISREEIPEASGYICGVKIKIEDFSVLIDRDKHSMPLSTPITASNGEVDIIPNTTKKQNPKGAGFDEK